MINLRALGLLLSALVGLMPMAGYGVAMQALSDDEMEDVSGAGIAVALENFRYMMAPTSYMEQVGVTPPDACTGSGNVASNINCWRRGDLRWYGINLSGATGAGGHWNEAACDAGASGLDCPRGGPIIDFSPFDNPYIMRSWSPVGMAHDGTLINTDPENPTKTIYEYLAPTNQPDYTLSFWGEIEVGATRNPALQPLSAGSGIDLLKSQTIIRGNAAGSIFRLFKYTESGANPEYGETFAMFYHSRLRGDFRFSVAQATNTLDAIGQAPQFAAREGLHFYGVDAFLPIGQLYYQALVLDAEGTNGDFSLSLTRIPGNNPTVYGRYYGMNGGDTLGYETARRALLNLDQPCGNSDCENYRLSHGHIRYGDWYPAIWSYEEAQLKDSGGQRNVANADNQGILFKACIGCSDFRAYAYRPIRIDKRGVGSSRQLSQNYNCPTGNAATGCSVNWSTNAAPPWPSGTPRPPEYSLAPGGPVKRYGPDTSRTYQTSTVNLGDSRMEGLLINRLDLISCQSGAC